MSLNETQNTKLTCFTRWWFYITSNHLVWDRFLHGYRDKPFNYLEVGSYEGMSAHWIASHFRNAHFTCIDTFDGSDEHEDTEDLEARFDFNLWPYRDRLTKLVGKSSDRLRELQSDFYDVIYIDGDHHARQVFEDAKLALPLLKTGGLLIFDDYHWHPPGDYTKDDCPALGIDTFLKRYEGRYDVLHKEYQVVLRKKVQKY